jgi:hypothetical protein
MFSDAAQDYNGVTRKIQDPLVLESFVESMDTFSDRLVFLATHDANSSNPMSSNGRLSATRSGLEAWENKWQSCNPTAARQGGKSGHGEKGAQESGTNEAGGLPLKSAGGEASGCGKV